MKFMHATRNAPPYFRGIVAAVTIIGLILVTLPSLGQDEPEAGTASLPDRVGYNEHIRPLLSRHCIACHGPDKKERKGGLRVDTAEGIRDAIDLDDPEDSELIWRMISEEDDRMPPPGHGEPLKPSEVALFRKWIEQGATYEIHWSFVPPVKSDPPKIESDWGKNEIDHFVAAKLRSLNLSPSRQSDPRRLIRRVALDLTGLPPTREMVERFAATPTDEVYERIVDELLASSAYGEHWAGMWLDLARYADSTGYASDPRRTIWPWRDWVIRAFNENMPYDQFTMEQIAGDLLPDASVDQKLATAFHRNTLNNNEGGTNDEEFRTIAVKDRVNTTVNVWMGLTMRCAECHTHKYDPISQKEYYQFLDFFNQTADADRNDEAPRLDVFPAGREAILAKLDSQIESIKKERAKQPPVWNVLAPRKAMSKGGATTEVLEDQSVLVSGKNPEGDEYSVRYPLPAGEYTGLRLEVIPDDHHGGNVGRSEEGSIVLSKIDVKIEAKNAGERALAFADAAADHSQRGYDIRLAIRDKIDDKGWAVAHPKQKFKVRRTAVLSFAKPLKVESESLLSLTLSHRSPYRLSNIGRFRLSATQVAEPAKKYREKKLDPLQRRIANLQHQRRQPVRVPIMQELPLNAARTTHVLVRGSFLQPGEPVSASVLKEFHPLSQDAPKNRLGVARWLMSDANPLTARVAVNRFWARMFGMGIVETEEDFGTQGTLPSNQPLLDWLAVDFRESGWDVKRLLKKIVMSATYRQSSQASERQLQIDPRNEFLSRGPRFRLRAEAVRDQALAVSGLLSKKMYGPPVYPPNPIKQVRNAFSAATVWTESQGEDRYRRAIYTFLKRSSPHPLFETFDMASREVCNMRRIRTNTPLQSFMTLNDPTFIEAAQALAIKMRDHSPDWKKQIGHGLELALFRPANPRQLKTLSELYQTVLPSYQANPTEAVSMAGTDPSTETAEAAELAALTVVANVILNLDSFLTK